MSSLDPAVAALLKDPTTLIPAVVQDSTTNEVLMLAYMNSESLALTLSTGKATFLRFLKESGLGKYCPNWVRMDRSNKL